MKLKSLNVAVIIALLLGMFAMQAQAGDVKKNVLFVCQGNIMRSVIAELLFEKMLAEKNLSEEYTVISRGMQGTPALSVLPVHNNIKYYNEANGANVWEQSLPSLKKLGIDEKIQENKSTAVTAKDMEQADLVVALSKDVMEDPEWGLKSQFSMSSNKIILFTEIVGSDEGISDAYASKEEGNKYEKRVYAIADVMKQGFHNLLQRLQ